MGRKEDGHFAFGMIRRNIMDNIEKDTVGTLYVVATPIGNSRDLSPRATEILNHVDIIAAEDTRRSIILMNKLGIRNTLVSNHKFNEYGKATYFVKELLNGKDVAIISDAGTPCISDPGNELIKSAIENNIKIVGVPGCCAAIAALSVSGFDLKTFCFMGFFPRENAERRKVINTIRHNKGVKTYAFYESPRRIMDVIDFFIDEEVKCTICLCNDITKLHEMTFRGNPKKVKSELLQKGNYDKGEFVLVAEFDEQYLDFDEKPLNTAEAMIIDAMVVNDCNIKDAINIILQKEDNPYKKNELKKAAIILKNMMKGVQ